MLSFMKPLAVAAAIGVVFAVSTPSSGHAVTPTISLTAVAVETPAPDQAMDGQEMLDGLKAAGVPHTSTVVDGDERVTFTLDDGLTLTFVEPAEDGRIGGGEDAGGIYILFNAWEQGAIINGGMAAGGAALCLLPGVGAALCAAFEVLILVAANTLATNGVCQNGQEMKLYIGGNQGKCVTV
ncbi:hypothetical protein [Plantibacter sp. RU18]|uniref:hypothetical protein n=1 Tax=Plantibacter sp. RU18 TaxID=3158143 RepID=UPI003D3638AF